VLHTRYMTRRQYNLAIERKEVDDDYHNHFLSHFGFYDEQPSDYGFNKYYSTPYDIQGGSKD
jgi:hypothetical protein